MTTTAAATTLMWVLAIPAAVALVLWALVPVDVKLVVFLAFAGWAAAEERKQVRSG